MHPDLLQHLSRTSAERRPTGMALALAAMCARTISMPLDAHLIEPLAAACALCLADLCGGGHVSCACRWVRPRCWRSDSWCQAHHFVPPKEVPDARLDGAAWSSIQSGMLVIAAG